MKVYIVYDENLPQLATVEATEANKYIFLGGYKIAELELLNFNPEDYRKLFTYTVVFERRAGHVDISYSQDWIKAEEPIPENTFRIGYPITTRIATIYSFEEIDPLPIAEQLIK